MVAAENENGIKTMKYSLRSLMIAAILAPPLLALAIVAVQNELKKRGEQDEMTRWLEQYDKDMALYGSDAYERNQSHIQLPDYLVNRITQHRLSNSAEPAPNPPKREP
jgi:hypothetical protein